MLVPQSCMGRAGGLPWSLMSTSQRKQDKCSPAHQAVRRNTGCTVWASRTRAAAAKAALPPLLWPLVKAICAQTIWKEFSQITVKLMELEIPPLLD